jgi:hypothetical protein
MSRIRQADDQFEQRVNSPLGVMEKIIEKVERARWAGRVVRMSALGGIAEGADE